MKEWKLERSPRDWQSRAFQTWREKLEGIVQVVTGGGKTVFAQVCILEFTQRFSKGQTLIIVPTISLLDQWFVALQEELGVVESEIGLLSGQEKATGDEPIIIAVINTARRFTKRFTENRSIFLIVDECHRAGSPANAKALEGNFAATLGLSATPDREYDEGFETFIRPCLGPIIYEYDYRDAARDGILSPFALTNIHIEMLPDEEENYQKLSRRIAQAMSRLGVEEFSSDEHLKRLLQQRAAVSATATMRIPVSVRLIEMHKGERAIIFHERVEAADKIFSLLTERGHRATIYHSGIGSNIRRDNLRLFRKGVFDVLVCCRALDEGMNVPEASVAVISSSTASRRQRIQRLGRILRKAKGKEAAIVYTIYATKEERERLDREEQILEGITEITWQHGRVRGDA